MAEKNWSERVEELVDEGDRHGAIKLLQEVVECLQCDDGADTNLSLAAAMGDLAALYEQDGLSMKADSLRSSAIVIRQRARATSASPVVELRSHKAGTHSGDADPRETEEAVEEEWEKADLALPESSRPSSPPISVSKMSLEDSAPKQRGRGAFKFGSSGLYSDQKTSSGASLNSKISSKLSTEDEHDELTTDEDTHNNLVYGAGHVVVIGGFSTKTTTKDLEDLVKPFANRGVAIRWVNDKTAIAVFRNPTIAREALTSIQTPLYKLQRYDEALEIHGFVARKDLEPPAPRPATSARAAQRMIVGALQKQGIVRSKVQPKTKFTAEELQKQEDERRQRLLAREKLREEAWDFD